MLICTESFEVFADIGRTLPSAFFPQVLTGGNRLSEASPKASKGIQLLERRPADLTLETGHDVQAVQRRQNPEPAFFMHG